MTDATMTVSDDELIARLERRAGHIEAWGGYEDGNLHREAAARLRSISESKREWLPIETAPKGWDAPILAYNSRLRGFTPVVVRWNDEPHHGMPDEPHWADAATRGGTALYYNSLFFDFWVPLPAAPARAVIAKEAGHAE